MADHRPRVCDAPPPLSPTTARVASLRYWRRELTLAGRRGDSCAAARAVRNLRSIEHKLYGRAISLV